MMKLWNKIRINPITYFIILISLFSGLFKYLTIISLIICVHESGHILIACLFKRKISKIEILPFGGLIRMDCNVSESIYEDLLISIGGILAQLVLALLIFILKRNGILDSEIYNTISMYNVLIVGFNMIPICPLDGYKMLKLIMELFIPFKKTFLLGLIMSFILIIFIGLFKFNIVKDNVLVFVFLIYMSIAEYKNRKYILLRFYLERMNMRFKFSRIKHIEKIDDMYKNRLNIINGIEEYTYLKCNYLCK